MKKIVLLVFVFVASVSYLFSQTDSVKKDTAWKFGGQFVLTVSQAQFNDWAAGGENSRSGNSRISLFANYAKGKTSWENSVDMAYGLSDIKGIGIRKNDDILELSSKFGYKASKKWNYSALLGAKTQFYEGLKYFEGDSSQPISDFLSPLNVNLAFGADYKPNKFTSVFLSPLNSKYMFVSDTSLRKLNSLEPDKSFRYELGFIAKLKYQRDIIENVNLLTKLDLFIDYLRLGGFDDIDVSWEVLITMKVFKLLSVNLNTHVIWDKDIKTTNTDGSLGDAKLQFKEIFGAGITYKF